VVVATTTQAADRAVLALAEAEGVAAFAGSESDVLDRYYRAALHFRADVVMRITADCPLLDPDTSAAVLARFRSDAVDYASNTRPPAFPDGMDTEVFSLAVLARVWQEARLAAEREHVTLYIRNHADRFRLAQVSPLRDYSRLHLSLDEPSDLERIRAIYARLPAGDYRYCTVLAVLTANPALVPTGASDLLAPADLPRPSTTGAP
jgi:spore coat polysaccharide biosynthesis protein SpsF (cytidylyltransferase family)